MNRRVVSELFGPTLALYLIGKVWYRTASLDDLYFLISPLEFLLCLAGVGEGEWVDGAGFYHASGEFLIDGSCAGFNFLLITYLLMASLLWTRINSWSLHPVALLLAWPVTVVANASRILSMLLLSVAGFDWPLAGMGHEIHGGFTYLFFLTGTGLLFRRPSLTFFSNEPT